MSILSLSAFPYLRLTKSATVANWTIGPATSFLDTDWTDGERREFGLSLLRKVTDAYGDRVDSPTILRRNTGRIGDTLPTSKESVALRRAIGFAVLAKNRRYGTLADHLGWTVLTSENTELYAWRLNTRSRWVTMRHGSMMRSVLDGGWNLDDDDFAYRAAPEIDTHHRVQLDQELAQAVYKVCRGDQDGMHPGSSNRIGVAIDWLLQAWRNTPHIRPQDRVVFLKTAFEVLTQSGSSSRRCASGLRDIFESLGRSRAVARSARDAELLWSPLARKTFERRWRAGGEWKSEQLSGIEHWLMALADARNAILHEGRASRLLYQQSKSPFRGHLVWTAEWVLRCAIRVSLAEFGYSSLWKTDLDRLGEIAWARLNNIESDN